jgi:two-component system, cell cycle response regulator
MDNHRYQIGLCGLSPKDRRMVEIVLGRAVSKRYQFAVIEDWTKHRCDLVLVDDGTAQGPAEHSKLKFQWPRAIAVHISEDGKSGDTPFRIARRMLLSRVTTVLEDAIGSEGAGMRTSPTPAVAQPVFANVAAAPVPRPIETGPLRALVVDDSSTVRNQLEIALGRIGVKCDLAANTDEASAALLSRSFDFILLDVVMPGTDGYTFCRNLRSQREHKQLPVIMLTSRSSPFDRARGALAGCDSYLVKPIDLKTFHGAVDKVVLKKFRNDRNELVTRGYRIATA